MPSGEHKTKFGTYIDRCRTFISGSEMFSMKPGQNQILFVVVEDFGEAGNPLFMGIRKNEADIKCGSNR